LAFYGNSSTHKLLSCQIQLPANVELDNLIAKFFTVYIAVNVGG